MANKAVQVDFMLSGLSDTSNVVLASGKVYTYEVGTTTNKAMYVDAAQATPAANPVILDGGGRAAVYADGAYKVVVKNSADTTIYTWDNLQWGTPEVRLPETTNPTNEAGAGYFYSKDDGGNNKPYYIDDAGVVSEVSLGAAGGDVTGPGSATGNGIAIYNLTTGKIIKDSGAVISTAGDLYLAGDLQLTAGAAPTNAPNTVWFYGKDVAGKPEAFAMDEDGNEVQLTSVGSLNSDAAITSHVVVKLSGDQTILSTAEDTIAFDTEVEDTGTEFNTGTNIFTAAAAGVYLVTLGVTANYAVLSYFHPRIYKNAAVYHASEHQQWASGSAENGAKGLSIPVRLAATDTITFKLYAESGNVILKSGVYTMASITKIGT